MDSLAWGWAEKNGEDINKMGAYSFKSLKNKQNKTGDVNGIQQEEGNACYKCGNTINGQIGKHKPSCTARKYKCKRMGHFGNFCKSTAEINYTN